MTEKNIGQTESVLLASILDEIREQPPWRIQADKAMDYKDGNQLDSETLLALEAKGIPPATQNMIGPLVNAAIGFQINNKTDLKILPDVEGEDTEEIAEALNYKINQAERRSNMDSSCLLAFEPQIGAGLGWVEVSRETNPFKFPYRCLAVHRGEIFWDHLARESDLSDARWLLRKRWTDIDVVKSMFPGKKDLCEQVGNSWGGFDQLSSATNDGDTINLFQSWEIERGWDVAEQEWRVPESGRVCLFEVQKRKRVNIYVLRLSDNRVVEFDLKRPEHIMALRAGRKLESHFVSKITVHFFLGPHLLGKRKSEFDRFNYVPFWGTREDRTNIPYGIIRDLIFPQDEVNARIAKQQWALSATRTVRTDGAVALPDDQFREECGRPDADIILNQREMAKPGAMFEVSHNEAINSQQEARLKDLIQLFQQSVQALEQPAVDMRGDISQINSGEARHSLQSVAKFFDNYKWSRQQVGELLLALIIKDIGTKREVVTIKREPLQQNKIIALNDPVDFKGTGVTVLNNNLLRTRLRVTMCEIPSTASYKAQNRTLLQEVMKSLPDDYQKALMPYLAEFLDIPNKEAIIEAMVELRDGAKITEEQVQERVREAVEKTKTELMVELKTKELEIKERKTEAEIEKIITEQVNNRIEGMYSAIQAGLQVTTNSGVAASADQILHSAGAEDQDEPPLVDITGPITVANDVANGVPDGVTNNTSPLFPPRIQEERADAPRRQPARTMAEGDEEVNRGIESPLI